MYNSDLNMKPTSIQDIARYLGATLLLQGKPVNECNEIVINVSTLHDATENEISFCRGKKYSHGLASSHAMAILVDDNDIINKSSAYILLVDDLDRALIALLQWLYIKKTHASQIPNSARVSPNTILPLSVSLGEHASIGKNCTIGENVAIGNGCVIGDCVTILDNTIIHANVVIYDATKIGRNVIIDAGSVIGADGFGFIQRDSKNIKIPHIGIVEIEDDVHIGANTCIDRASFGVTRIGQNTIIDNLVQIGHNVTIGDSAILCAQTGIAGSARLKSRSVFAGKSGVVNGVTIEEDAVVCANSIAIKDVPAGQHVFGTPAIDKNKFFRNFLRLFGR